MIDSTETSFGATVFKYNWDNSQIIYPFIPASAKKVHVKLVSSF